VAADREEKHIFYSSGAARTFSAMNNVQSQGIVDLIKEMSSSVNVKILSERESLISLLKSGIPVDDLLSLRTLQSFLKTIGETSRVHKIIAEDSSERRIEEYSEITVNYYKYISELGKSEVEDFSEFINLFPLKYNLSSDYVSHLPAFLKPYATLFTKGGTSTKREPKILKKKFPDYSTEFRWIVRDILLRGGTKAIAVPDDYCAVGIAKELELYGIKPNIVSPVSAVLVNDSPYNFVISSLRCIDDDFSYESIISLLENPYSDVEPLKIADIKDQSYEKNITRGLRDWKTLFHELKIESKILNDLESLSGLMGKRGAVTELILYSNRYLGENNYPGRILDLLSFSFPDYSNDASGLINDIESLKHLPKVSSPCSSDVTIGKPIDLLGLSFENLYISGQDSASSSRSFPEEARDLLNKIGLEGAYENFTESIYRVLMESSGNVYVSYSTMDDKLSYTESTSFYDSIEGEEEYASRDSVFIPSSALSEWEIGIPTEKKNKYALEEGQIKSRIEKPIYPTFIENYIGCHFKGFVNGLLGVDEIDAPREFLDPRTTGTLTHRILEKYYSTDISPNDFSRLADSYVRSEISKEIYESRIEALRYYREKYLINGRLARFFVLDVNHARELGRKTVQKEFHFPTVDQQVFYELGEDKISIGGYVDRVDEENGNLCIIDYKSSLYGYPANDLCDESHGKVQLFFYKIGVESILKKKVKAAAYVSFKDINDGYSTAGFFHAIQNEEAQIKKCREIVDPPLEDFLKGDCDPVVKIGGNLWKCENVLFCPLLSTCRVQERRW
jgi:hypothetical protein